MQNMNAVKVAQKLLKDKVKQASLVLDATMGNGSDTLFLAEQTPPEALVYAFDIQKTAIEKTREQIVQNNWAHKVHLILDSHANMNKYLPDNQKLDVVMFNLGYLPGGSHSLVTKAESTVMAIKKAVARLAVGGRISIVAYTRHNGGQEETLAVEQFVSSLPQNIFTVACWQTINHVNYPPKLYIIEKMRGEMFEGDTSF
ncbi:hypothetical protein P22_0354 [Propionispora sp. 2/2-37]|uniref:class I SAM-dependent methyltransferase n=1 Tax=Propionispora sp. 2/2-37 TaxID=1677858 RepID=UPI0006BB9576|nr:class I SAM-dependent methyltransferase [Propionispora sp. 2/2-37]CUH94288.1 hypothetical protein P22_0354 [Propionispora sp. 2/2-37]